MGARSVALIVAASAVTALGAAAAGPGAPTAGRPLVRLVDESPIVVRGSGFRPRERIVVRVAAGDDRWSRRLAAGPRGGFTARWERARLRVCLVRPEITARGRRSGLVEGTVPPRECAMP